MKLRTQLLILVLLALAGLAGVAGLAQYQLDRVYTATNFANVNSMPAIIALDDTAGALTRLRVSLYQHLLSKDSAEMSAIEQKMAKARADMDKGLKAYEATLVDERDRQLFQADNSAVAAYDALREKVLSLSRVNKTDEALALLSANQPVLGKVTEAFDEHRQYNVVLGQKGAEEAVAIKQTATGLSLAISALVLAAIGITGWRTARKVMEQLGCEPSEAAEYARQVAAGDLAFHMNVQDKDPGSLIVAMHSMVGAIQALVGDAATLAKAGVEGRLSTRADAAKHQGEYRRIVQGVNDTLDAVIGPLNVAAHCVAQIASGQFPEKISDQYQGDFNLLKNNLNACIEVVTRQANEAQEIAHAADAIAAGDLSVKVLVRSDQDLMAKSLIRVVEVLQGLQKELRRLTEASREGLLSERGRPEQFKGAYGEVVRGVNDMLDAILLPIGEGNRILTQISAGKIDELIVQTYQGDHEKMKQAVNNVATTLQGLQNELERLTVASAEGQLSERGKPEQFKGAYADVIRGVNEMLDAILIPIGEGNRVLRQIRGGNLRQRVEIACKGDHEQMKNAINGVHGWLNDLIAYVTKMANGDMTAEMAKASSEDQIHEWLVLLKRNIQALVADADLLVGAAVAGQLATRADAAKHQGDYRKIIEGVNETLDAIVGPVEEVVRVLGALAQGDLTEKIQATHYQGTFAQLRDDANTTVDNLAASVLNIKEATDAINTAAKEIATGNADLSQRTEEQASSLEETASSMEQLASTVKQNADNARQANQMAVAASDVAIRGGDMVQKVVGTMSDINESSRKVVDIIGVIDGIAFQTNILALNAAVEAARAGEQGRGFAVVAGEVRNLAQRSAAAAKEIKALIGDSVDKAEGGAKLVAEAGKTMDEIVTSVKRVTDIMSEIAAASVEQSSGIEQVNQAITQMDDVTQQNAALVEEAAASAESLEDQAGVLAQAVARFRLSQGSAFLAPPRTTQLAAHKPAAPKPANKRGKPSATYAAPPARSAADKDDWAEF